MIGAADPKEPVWGLSLGVGFVSPGLSGAEIPSEPCTARHDHDTDPLRKGSGFGDLGSCTARHDHDTAKLRYIH